MNRRRYSYPRTAVRIAALAAVLGVLGGLACRSAEPGASSRAEARLEYVEVLTAGARSEETLPMIVVIHGLGDEPARIAEIFGTLKVPARLILPRGPDPWGDGYSWFPVVPAHGAKSVRGSDLARSAARIASLVDELVKTKATRGRPFVTGFSQGGMLTFVLATHHGDRFARALPIAGWMPEDLWPAPEEAKRATPMLALHGELDPIVPFAATKGMVGALAERGAKIELFSEPGVRHTISPKMAEVLFRELEGAAR